MALTLMQEEVSIHRIRIVSDSMSVLRRIQHLHPLRQVFNSDEDDIINALASITDGGFHLTFICCPSHSGVRGNELADLAINQSSSVGKDSYWL